MDARVELDSVVINRPIEEVFSFLTNMENSPVWGRSKSTTQISNGTVSVGTRFREISAGSEEGIEMETVITGLEPPVSYSYTVRYENGIEERARVSLEDVAGGTRVQPTAEIQLPDVPQDQEGAVVAEMRTEVKGILENLKSCLEDNSPTATGP
jgi:uncharacterized protein YndB with AHSA1/START domain